MNVQPYLFFEGRCEEAINFYRGAIGAELEMMMRYKDNPDKDKKMCDQSGKDLPGDKVMHSSFHVGGSTILASDGMCSGTPNFSGVSLSLTVPNKEAAEKAFAALGAGGQVQMPMMETFFS